VATAICQYLKRTIRGRAANYCRLVSALAHSLLRMNAIRHGEKFLFLDGRGGWMRRLRLVPVKCRRIWRKHGAPGYIC